MFSTLLSYKSRENLNRKNINNISLVLNSYKINANEKEFFKFNQTTDKAL